MKKLLSLFTFLLIAAFSHAQGVLPRGGAASVKGIRFNGFIEIQ